MSTPASPSIDPAAMRASSCDHDVARNNSIRCRSPRSRVGRPGTRRFAGDARIGAMTKPAESSVAKALERRIVVAPGVELHVEVQVGDRAAAPFVLVHGLASNARLWDGVAEHLHAAGHTVVVIDQRGHGL